MPKVSVVIASYNHEKYVRASLDSVLAQSCQDFEILVTDDGSSDATAARVRECAIPASGSTCLRRTEARVSR